MTDAELAEIEARANAATEGPWSAGTAACCADAGWVNGPRGPVCPTHEATKRTHTLEAADAEFIAAARADVPALVAEVRGLKVVVEAIQGLVVEFRSAMYAEDAGRLHAARIALLNAGREIVNSDAKWLGRGAPG